MSELQTKEAEVLEKPPAEKVESWLNKDAGGLERPECLRCRNGKLQCSYPTSRRKPGPPKGTPPSRMTALHARIGQLESLLKVQAPNPVTGEHAGSEASVVPEDNMHLPHDLGPGWLNSPDETAQSSPDYSKFVYDTTLDETKTNQLLDIYFTTIQPMFPLFQRRAFFAAYHAQILPPDLITMMLALAQRVYTPSPSPSTPDPALAAAVRRIERNIEKKELHYAAIRLADIKIACLCIVHQFACGPNRYTWMLMGKLARIVYGCKLHQVDRYDDASSPSLDGGVPHPYFPDVSREELRYVWWTVVKIDSSSNVLAGTPCAVDTEIAATRLPCSSVADFTAGVEVRPEEERRLKHVPRIGTDAFWTFLADEEGAVLAADGQRLQLAMCLLLRDMGRRMQVTLAGGTGMGGRKEYLEEFQVRCVRICEALPAWCMEPRLATQHYETRIRHRTRLEALLQLRLCCLYSCTPSLLHLNRKRARDPDAGDQLLQVWETFVSHLMAAVDIYRVMPSSYYEICDPMMSSGVWILGCMLSVCLMQQAPITTDLVEKQSSPLRQQMETGFEALTSTIAGFAKMWPMAGKLLESLESVRSWHSMPLDLGEAVELIQRLQVPFPIHDTNPAASDSTIYDFDVLGTCKATSTPSSLDDNGGDLHQDLQQFWPVQ